MIFWDLPLKYGLYVDDLLLRLDVKMKMEEDLNGAVEMFSPLRTSHLTDVLFLCIDIVISKKPTWVTWNCGE